MFKRSALLAVVLMSVSATAFAQSAEFGRMSGGQIEVATKAPTRFSGSLNLTTGFGYGGTFGATVVKDRLWFFGSAQHVPARPDFTAPNLQTPRFDAKMSAQLGARSTLGGSFSAGRDPFLSLRYTGVVSSTMFVTANITRQ